MNSLMPQIGKNSIGTCSKIASLELLSEKYIEKSYFIDVGQDWIMCGHIVEIIKYHHNSEIRVGIVECHHNIKIYT